MTSAPSGSTATTFEVSLYNHGPLVGWLLLAINWLLDHHVTSFPFLIRLPACLADFVTALLVFELVRLARSAKDAAVAASLVVWSPVLFVISGFHGNTDPVFVMFALLSVYLLVVRRWALAAGVAFGIAVSIKLVPVVLAPLLLVVVLVRLGRRRLAAFSRWRRDRVLPAVVAGGRQPLARLSRPGPRVQRRARSGSGGSLSSSPGRTCRASRRGSRGRAASRFCSRADSLPRPSRGGGRTRWCPPSGSRSCSSWS